MRVVVLGGCDIQISNEQGIVPIDEQQLKDTAAYVLGQFGLKAGTVSIAVVNDETIAELKGRYFGEAVVTDVISFDLGGPCSSGGAGLHEHDEEEGTHGSEVQVMADSGTTPGPCCDSSIPVAEQGGTSSLDCEVVVNAERAAAVGGSRSGGALAELNLYVVHGLLHQLGYDDQTPDQAEIMHKKEDELLVELGFGEVYYPAFPG